MESRSITAELREACGYGPDDESSVDDLIGYKDALEGLVDRVDALMHAAAGRPETEGDGTPSGADVCAALWEMGFGADPRPGA